MPGQQGETDIVRSQVIVLFTLRDSRHTIVEKDGVG